MKKQVLPPRNLTSRYRGRLAKTQFEGSEALWDGVKSLSLKVLLSPKTVTLFACSRSTLLARSLNLLSDNWLIRKLERLSPVCSMPVANTLNCICIRILSISINTNVNRNTLYTIHQFYCINTSYLMDNCYSSQQRLARQMTGKTVLCFHLQDWSRTVHSLGSAWCLLSA